MPSAEDTIRELWESYFEAVFNQDNETALSAITRLTELELNDPQVYLKLGDLLARAQDVPGAVVAYHVSAGALAAAGHAQKALSVYKAILRISPDDAVANERVQQILDTMEDAAMEEAVASPSFGDATRTATLQAEDAALPDEAFSGVIGFALPEGEERRITPLRITVPEIFAALSDVEFDELCRAATHRSFSNGEVVVSEGDPGESIFTIKSGKAIVTTTYRGRSLVIATLSDGDFFGEIALLARRPRTATVTAFGSLELMEISKDTLKTVVESHPQITKRLIAFFYSRVRDSREKLKSGKKPLVPKAQ
jgi:hypothetical protein